MSSHVKKPEVSGTMGADPPLGTDGQRSEGELSEKYMKVLRKGVACKKCDLRFPGKTSFRLHFSEHNGLKPNIPPQKMPLSPSTQENSPLSQKRTPFVSLPKLKESFSFSSLTVTSLPLFAATEAPLFPSIEKEMPLISSPTQKKMPFSSSQKKMPYSSSTQKKVPFSSSTQKKVPFSSSQVKMPVSSSAQKMPLSSFTQKKSPLSPSTQKKMLFSPSTQKTTSLSVSNELSKKPQSLALEKKPLKCSQCTKSFSRKNYLHLHLRVHSKGNPFSCPECGERFSHKLQLKVHQRVHHAHKKQPLACPECDKSFFNRQLLAVHQRVHTLKKQSLACPECDKRFPYKLQLKVHQLVHTRKRPFTCPECDKDFPFLQRLSVHVLAHIRKKLFSCDKCDEQFSAKSKLTTHLRRHSEENLFSCDQCAKRFVEEEDLKEHSRVHTQGKSYSCPECHTKFPHMTGLSEHRRVRHKDKPLLACEHRLELFATETSLTEHSQAHTFACSKCPASFSSRLGLRRHINNHSRYNKPLRCRTCRKVCVDRIALFYHRRIHAGAPRFSCNSCSRNFTTLHGLNYHVSHAVCDSSTTKRE